MQLSYNLIKDQSENIAEKKEIKTNYVSKAEKEKEEEEEIRREKEKKSPDYDVIKSYENIGASIIKKAKIESESLVMESRELSFKIEKESYEKGHAQGLENGYEDGYRKGYEEAIERVNEETEEAVKTYIDGANEVLLKANEDYKDYLAIKEKDIIILALNIAKIIANKEITLPDGVNTLIEDVLKESKGEENLIIRCNSDHIDSINEKIDYYKKAYGIKGDIFILEDSLMEPGNAIVEKPTGKSVVGIDIALEKLEEALLK